MSVPVPRLVAWELTRRCNLRCRHCRAGTPGETPSAGPVRGESDLSLSEAKRVVDDIASFARPILILTGGEPLLCPHLFDLIVHARENGLKPVLGTNATLIDAALAARLAAAGIARVSVSVDFPTAARHDAFRGVAGAFDAAVRGIRALRSAGVGVQINTTVTRLNRRLLEDIHALAVSLDVQALHPFLLVPTGRGADLADEELTAEEYEETLKWICERQKTSPLELKPTDAPQYRRIVRQSGGGCGLSGKGCLAGTGFAFIGHAGDVRPCGYFDLKLGNVRQTPFSRIWRESPVLDDLRHPERLKGKCGICEFKPVCGGCRARALAKTGDFLSEEPLCAHLPDRALVDLLQTDFPLVERPYAALGARLGLTEADCYARVRRLRDAGIVRRVGASFAPSRLGRVTTLVAAQVDGDRLDAVAEAVNACPQVTHDYGRDDAFNLWFALDAKSGEEIARIVNGVRGLPGVRRVLELPAERVYKLRAVFASSDTAGAPRQRDATGVSRPQTAVRMPCPQRFRNILDRGVAPFSAEELAQLRAAAADGTIRRFGAFVPPRAVGFVANALVAWQVPPERLDAAGAAVSASPFVSHCYARTPREGWPYTLYAMVHAKSDGALRETCAALSSAVGASAGEAIPCRILKTRREYVRA